MERGVVSAGRAGSRALGVVRAGVLSAAGALSLVVAAVGPAVLASDDEDAPASPRSEADVAAAVDRALAAAWEREGIRPAARCTDAEFVRRAHLDIVGTIPTALQVDDFLRDASPGKRARLVEDLLATPGAARHSANRWAEVLVGAGVGENVRDYAPGLFLPWLEAQMAADRPFGAWVTELLTAEGTSYTNPAVNFTGRKDFSPTDLAGSVSRSFLGVQIQCAQCHDHPYEDITQAEFTAFSAFWGRMRLRGADIPYEMFGPQAAERERLRLEKEVAELVKTGVPEAEARVRAERRLPKCREVTEPEGGGRPARAVAEGRMRAALGEAARATPKFLKGAVYEDAAGRTRRGALAAWITSPENPYTARALANRVWGWFLGRGIVHPVDDFTSANAPVSAEALDVLAADTAAHGFDVRRLVRIVTATRAYRTTTAGAAPGDRARALFAAGPLKPLTAQQSFDSLNVALGIVADGRALTLAASGPTALELDGNRPGMMRMTGEGGYEQPDRARQMVTQAARSFFGAFDDDEGGADTTFEGTVPQGLFLLNSNVVNGFLLDRRVSAVPAIVETWKDEAGRIRQLFLRTLSREPTPAETQRFTRFVRESAAASGASGAPGPPRDARRGRGRPRVDESADAAPYADVLWVLLASSEFGTNH